MLNIAIVGMGGIGNVHARVYRDNPLAQIVAVCDIIPEKADKAGAEYGVPAFYSVAELLAAGLPIDAVSVTTAGVENGGDHYVPTMQVLEHGGIAVLGEKPISNELAKAQEMVALAAAKGTRYGVNLNHRFTPAAERARSWLDDGRLGTLNMLNMRMWIPNPNESSPHFHIRALHPHSIDVMRYFAGDAKDVYCTFRKGQGRTIWSNLQANILFENGVLGHLTGSYDGGGAFGLEQCELVASEARVVITDACVELALYPRRSTDIETFTNLGGMTGFMETFDSRIDAWLKDLDAGVPAEAVNASGADALKAQAVVEACIKSWDERRVVGITEILGA